MLASRGPIAVRVDRDAPFYRGAAALLQGDGTREWPLYFVLLACHADMADEGRVPGTERVVGVLAEEVLTRLRNEPNDLRTVLRISNAAAAATARYYSIAFGRVIQKSVHVVALGSIETAIMKGRTRTSIITPNVVRIGRRAILDGVFGVGFKEEAATVKRFDLEAGASTLLIIGEEPTIGNIEPHHDAEAFIEQIASVARISPPIIAVIG